MILNVGVSHKVCKILSVSRKSHYPIETLFHQNYFVSNKKKYEKVNKRSFFFSACTPPGEYINASSNYQPLYFFTKCRTFFRFFCDPQTFLLNVYPRIVYNKLLSLKLILSSKFSQSMMFVTVLGSYGAIISVSSEVSSCKYTYTYVINLRD